MGVTDNQFFKDVLFVIQCEEVNQIWSAENPCEMVQNCLLRYFEELKDKSGHDCQAYD